jgi:sarcosine oxidase
MLYPLSSILMGPIMKTAYEYIVVGCGGIGSAALYWLARAAGAEVLGIERFGLGHDRGESQDHSRIIRLSYHAPAYTTLTPHTYAVWREVEEESGVQLVLKTGGLDLELVEGQQPQYIGHYAESMRTAGIAHEQLTARQVSERWPQFVLPDAVQALYQPDSGLVDARKANAVHTTLARARGAMILERTPVRSIQPRGDTVEVRTDDATFTARRVVVASGAWSSTLLGGLGIQLPLTVTQEQVTYFQTPHLREFAPGRFPIWIWHGGPRSCFYGFPIYGEVATKAGQDVGGDVVTADTRTFEPNPRAAADLRRFLERYIPRSLGPELYTKTCLYTLTPDRDFVIDTLPEHPQIAIAIGAGHAFKFAGLLGRILGDLATQGETSYPIDAFRLSRPALTDPSFPASFMV